MKCWHLYIKIIFKNKAHEKNSVLQFVPGNPPFFHILTPLRLLPLAQLFLLVNRIFGHYTFVFYQFIVHNLQYIVILTIGTLLSSSLPR
jgi:hypothetical protein